MKTKIFAIAAAALTLAGGSASLAQPYGSGPDNDRAPGYSQDRDGRRDEPRRFSRGERLPESYRASRYTVDYRKHKLRAPPRGYRWQKVDNNFVLIAIASGVISEVVSHR